MVGNGVDTSDATITPETVLKPYVGYGADGRVVGAYEPPVAAGALSVAKVTEYTPYSAAFKAVVGVTVSGIPADWKRSSYNRRAEAAESLRRLLAALPARFILLSYNSEGFISPPEMREMLTPLGRVQEMVTDYATFRGCRNLRSRALHVQEHLYLLEK